MSKLSLARRAGSALVASALTMSLVAAGGAAQAAPADRGASWLAGELTDGLIISHTDLGDFPNYGVSIDTVFAFKAIGGHKADVRAVRHAVATKVTDYIGSGGERYAGATAKALVLAESTGADPTSFGGANLVRRLNHLVTKSGPAKGRIVDQSQFGDFANTVGQILAVRGLSRAGSGYAGKARHFLLEQQCDRGYFRLSFSKLGSDQQSCGQNSPADPDTTSYAVIELWKLSKGRPTLRRHLRRAAAWLADQQLRSGAFVGGASTGTPNTNSTGLAGWALAKVGRCSAAKAAAGWVLDLQVGPQPSGSNLAGERGAIAYDNAAMRLAKRHGITADTADQWQRATSQAAPALRFRHGC
jgi:hypothetical protein